MSNKNNIRARMRLLTSEEGGRRSWIKKGYRPALYIEEMNSPIVISEIIDKEKMNPGEEATVEIFLLWPQNFGETLKVDKTFQLKEGARVIARGKVIAVPGP